MANVRDLLIRMSLNTDNFKRNIADAKGELRALKAEYKAITSDSSLEDAGKKQVKNLRDQKEAAEALVKEYQKGIEEIQKKLSGVAPGTQAAGEMQKQISSLEASMNNAKAQVGELQAKIDEITLQSLVDKAEAAASIISNLQLGLGGLLDGAGGAADSADSVYVRREAARVSGTKSFEGATQDQLEALDTTVKELIGSDLPLLYEQMYGILEVAGQQGVAIENADKFATVMAKLSTATDMTADTGSQTMAQFVNLTEKNYDHLDNIGSALVALGNNSATSESQIMEMAHKAASGLHLVGMSSADILGVSAAISSMGIEAQAGGTAVSKLALQMDKSARVGAAEYQRLLDTWGDDSIRSASKLYEAVTKTKDGWKDYAAALGMSAADAKKLVKSAMAAETFSETLGISIEEYTARWKDNAASQLLQFFAALGGISDEEGTESMLWKMDELGIKEVRMSNMVRALSSNWEVYANSLALANQAYEENIAMDEEAGRAFSTNESRRVVNANKEQNALEAMGRTVTAMRKPWEQFFGDLKQWYAEWPGWAQKSVGAAAQIMGATGDALEKMGEVSFSILSITKAVQELEKSALGAALLKKLGLIGGAAATVLPGAAIVGGSIALSAAINAAYTEETFGGYNRTTERMDELLTTTDGKLSQYQEMLKAFAEAAEDEDYVPKLQAAWEQYGDELLRLFPVLKKDVHDNMDAMDWAILGAHAVDELGRGIDEQQTALFNDALEAGLQVDAGLAKGILDGESEALAAADQLAADVRDALSGGLDIHSPSGVARILGAYFSEGFALGIEDGVSRVEGAADRVARAVTASAGRRAGGLGSGSVRVNLHIDGKRVAQTLAPLVDEALGETQWD